MKKKNLGSNPSTAAAMSDRARGFRNDAVIAMELQDALDLKRLELASTKAAMAPAESSKPARLDPKNFVGAKGGEGVWQRIISEMPLHRVYVEAFLGTGTIMRRKRPAELNIGIERNPAVARQFDKSEVPGCKVKTADALEWLRGWTWQGDELLYCDPPYVMSSRRSQRPYYGDFEMSDDDHRRLLDILIGIPAAVMISGYPSQLYAQRLKSWRQISFRTSTRGGRSAVEVLWMNFAEPFELHDTLWLGKDFRERERIGRKRRRWASRLLRMGRLDRAAILEAIADARSKLLV